MNTFSECSVEVAWNCSGAEKKLFDFISKWFEQISKQFAKNETASTPAKTDLNFSNCELETRK
jgi:hypothetical protein